MNLFCLPLLRYLQGQPAFGMHRSAKPTRVSLKRRERPNRKSRPTKRKRNTPTTTKHDRPPFVSQLWTVHGYKFHVFEPVRGTFWVGMFENGIVAAAIREKQLMNEEDAPVLLKVAEDSVALNEFYPYELVGKTQAPVLVDVLKSIVVTLRKQRMTHARHLELYDLSMMSHFPLRTIMQIFKGKLGYYEQYGFRGANDAEKRKRLAHLYKMQPEELKETLCSLMGPKDASKYKALGVLHENWRDSLSSYIEAHKDGANALHPQYFAWAAVVFAWFRYVEQYDTLYILDTDYYLKNDIPANLELKWQITTKRAYGVHIADHPVDEVDAFSQVVKTKPGKLGA